MQKSLEERQALQDIYEIIKYSDKIGTPEHTLTLATIPRMNLVIQDGPYCPNNCASCYGDFGPGKEKASMELYQAIMEQIPDTAINQLIITDGEPFHNFKRAKEIMNLIKEMPVELVTSGTFASSPKRAKEGLEAIKEGGFTGQFKENRSALERKVDTLAISVNKFLPKKSYQRALNIIQTYEEVFPDAQDSKELIKEGNQQYHVAISHTQKSKNKAARKEILIQYALAHQLKAKKINLFDLRSVAKKNLIVGIHSTGLIPEGRGEKLFSNKKRAIQPEELHGTHPLSNTSAYVSSKGDVYLMGSYRCLTEGRKVGNIFQENLGTILAKEKEQALFLMERCFGVKGIYSHFEQILGDQFEAYEGRASEKNCDVCRNIFYNKETVDVLNKKFLPKMNNYIAELQEKIRSRS